ncbi:MAG: cytochrome c4 [Magnetococcales bacterium]|nr:cytochrome c4 [Magnetococcales bacterium]
MQQKAKRTLVLAGGLLAGVLTMSATPALAEMSAEMLSNTCAGCHGTNGVSAGPAMPTIAGMPAEHIKNMMKGFKSGERPSTIMDRISKGYTDEEIAAIAGFFAKQKWGNAVSGPNSKMATPIDAKLAKDGKKAADKCDKCHEDNGKAQEDDVPRLAGQWLDYIQIRMDDYKNPALKVPQPEKMAKQMDKKTPEELKAIAHFWASQK